MNRLLRLYYTIKPLKGRQLWYRIVQPLVKQFSPLCKVSDKDIAAAMVLPVIQMASLPVNSSYHPDNKSFLFLNLKVQFRNSIDWNYAANGALWAYNLNYFEWLYDDSISIEARLRTIHDYPQRKVALRVGLQCYPVSLRIVSWTRFLLRYGIRDKSIFKSLYQHASWLYRFPEYHLDGNHLWENAVALVCAGVFFSNKQFYGQGVILLTACMQEQLFQDGGHVEGSPMYHSLLLWRILQCIEMIKVLSFTDKYLFKQLKQAAEQMLGWLSAVTFSDGTWPAINDTASGIAPSTKELIEFAQHLGLEPRPIQLRDSHYRMIREKWFELFIDVAEIKPRFQPGHAHADIGTFCLHADGRPFIVDAGVSTYDEGVRRRYERSTGAHNTVTFNGKNSSDIWKSFRVGRRARILAFEERDSGLSVTHDDFRKIRHQRTFDWHEHVIVIIDTFYGCATYNVVLRLHFHPHIQIRQEEDFIFSAGLATIKVEFAETARIKHYEYAAGFNHLVTAPCIEIKTIRNRLITRIERSR